MTKLLNERGNDAAQARHFRTDHLQRDLKGRSIKGGLVTTTAQACKFLLQTGSTIFLARLLTPQDYGLVGMVTAITGLIGLFKDLGLSMATVQKAEINHSQVNTLFWVNVAVSLILAALTALLAPLIAGFYQEPRLVGITLALAIGFIFGGLTVQHQALLNRQMRFKSLAVIDVTAMTVSIGVALIAVSLGAGYWALVLMQLALGISKFVGDWIACSWRPTLPRWDASTHGMLAFGSNLTGFNLINYVARNLDNVLIGRFWGAQELGLYAKAYQLLMLPLTQINAPIGAVAVPSLSRLVDSPERYRRAYLRILEKLTIITMPMIAFTIVCADWLITLLLGEQWVEASRIFAWLSFSALTQPVSYTTGWLFITQNRTQHMFQWGLVGGGLSVLAILIGLPWGATGVAAVYAISGLLIRTPILFWFAGRTGPVKIRDFYHTMAPAATASICAVLGLLIFRQWVVVPQQWIGLAIALPLSGLITLGVLLLLPSGRAALQDFPDLLKVLREGKRNKTAS